MHRSVGFKRVLISSIVSSRFRRGAPCYSVCQHSHAVVRTSRIVFARSRASLAHRTLLQYSELALLFDRTFCVEDRADTVCVLPDHERASRCRASSLGALSICVKASVNRDGVFFAMEKEMPDDSWCAQPVSSDELQPL